MKSRTIAFALLAPVLVALPGMLPGCASKDKGTNVTQTTEPFESGDLTTSPGPTSTFVHIFGAAGTFSYRCRRHGGMTGTVTVSAGGADSAVVPIAGFAFQAPTAGSFPIKPGGYARWVNGDGTLHTVTRP